MPSRSRRMRAAKCKPMATCLWFDDGARTRAPFTAPCSPTPANRDRHRAAIRPGGREDADRFHAAEALSWLSSERREERPPRRQRSLDETQAEHRSRYWSAWTPMAELNVACLGCDRWGIRWQIIPRVLIPKASTMPKLKCVRLRVFADAARQNRSCRHRASDCRDLAGPWRPDVTRAHAPCAASGLPPRG